MSEEEITDEYYCAWLQSNCPLVKDYRARIAELEAKIKRLSNKNIISTDVRRERIYNAISAWTNASDTVCSCATEAIVRIVNDHFGG